MTDRIFSHGPPEDEPFYTIQETAEIAKHNFLAGMKRGREQAWEDRMPEPGEHDGPGGPDYIEPRFEHDPPPNQE